MVLKTFTILALLTIASQAKADSYPQNDEEYTRTGRFIVAHRSPDLAASECVDTAALPHFTHVDIRLIGEYVYAISDQNKAAKQKIQKMNSCRRLAFGTYSCESHLPMQGAYVTQVINIYPESIRVTWVVNSYNGKQCQITYE